MFADLPDHVVVPMGCDLYFYPLVACDQLGPDLFAKLLDRILNADRNAAADGLIHPAEMPPKRNAELFRLEVPAGGLDPGLRHPVAAGPLHQTKNVLCRSVFLADNHWSEDLFNRNPSGIGPFVRIARLLAAGHFAPPFGTVGVFDADKNDPAF